ncbi:MAG: hypothetical protein LWX56_01090 [Ignavibacteria bacterium]|nr:hypothetical protein [Ignavibacteria bacterium]
MIKTEILTKAITEQVQVRFYYGLNEVVMDPYFILFEEDGTKAIYGMTAGNCALRRFSFKKIANIRLLPLHFEPIVPVSPSFN